MCDCFQSAATIAIRCSGTRFRKLCLDQCNCSRKSLPFASKILLGYKDCSFTTNLLSKDKCIWIFRHQMPFRDQRFQTRLGVFGSNGFDLSSENLELGMQNGKEQQLKELELGFMGENEASDNTRTRDNLKGAKSQNDELGMLNFDEPLRVEGTLSKAEDLMASEDDGKSDGLELEEDQELVQSKPKTKRKPKRKLESRSRNQMMKRSSILAKQVIGIESAQSLGFVSQLWVDTATWAVLEVEVRPNLLSSDSVKFLLEDINKVGDVVLVEDENYILNEYKTAGLESLVGCSIVTPGQRNLGKVRGYTFNINSGTVESLELDAFGYSVIPSSLVSTYALSTEDVLEVVSDVIIVHEAAASRIQRLTKGFMGTKNAETSSINLKYRDLELESMQPVNERRTKRKSSKRKSKFYPRARDPGNDFELPMDYIE